MRVAQRHQYDVKVDPPSGQEVSQSYRDFTLRCIIRLNRAFSIYFSSFPCSALRYVSDKAQPYVPAIEPPRGLPSNDAQR